MNIIGGSMDDDKVSVSISEIENGYLINRNWCTKTKKDDGDYSHEYHSETYYLASLPPLIEKLFTKGKNATEMGGKTPDGNDAYDSAISKMSKGKEEGADAGDDADDKEETDEEE